MYYAFLGHMPDLSLLELQSLGLSASKFAPGIAQFAQDPVEVAPLLGGTIKIGVELARVYKDDLQMILSRLIEEDSSKNQAITDYANLQLKRSDLHSLKSSINRPVRFVSMETTPHEAIMLVKQSVSEYNLLAAGPEVIIARSIWFQTGLDWARRDRERPYQDIKRGMLPPKLSRVMVNLASHGQKGILLDPFCGTGTVLMEAALLGHEVIGSDNDATAVAGARDNLEWLSAKYQVPSALYQVQVADAVHVSEQVKLADYIVTEPYMGPLLDKRGQIDYSEVKNTAKGLDKLYRGCLRDWSKLLKVGGRIVMIFPSFIVGSKEISTISIDTITALGYNILRQIPYSKSSATVIRNITILEK